MYDVNTEMVTSVSEGCGEDETVWRINVPSTGLARRNYLINYVVSFAPALGL